MNKKIFLLSLPVFLLLAFPGFSFADETKLEIQESLAQAYMIDKDYERAIAQYREILRTAPSNLKARVAIADILGWQKKYDDSIREFEKALESAPQSLEIKKKLAEIFVNKEDFAKAEQLYREIILDNPGDRDAYNRLGEILSWQGKREEAAQYFKAALDLRKDRETRLSYGEVLLFSGDYAQAKKIFKELLDEDPSDIKAKVLLADTFSYGKEFLRAIELYREILGEREDLEVKRKLADVLSWNKQYKESLDVYDEILKEKEIPDIRLQKARVLGWSREYTQSISEYRRVFDALPEESVRLEMEAKRAYWNNRVKEAILSYEKLIEIKRGDVEAMFDLSQIYSYQSMWKDADRIYRKILDISPNHFRAKEGREKAAFLSAHCSLNSGYEFFEADSSGRQQDLKRNSFFNTLNFPLNHNLFLGLQQRLTTREFSDFDDLLENQERVDFFYLNNPGWNFGGFYKYRDYNKGVNSLHLFGFNHYSRISDYCSWQFLFERKELENNSSVIREGGYFDNYKERVVFDINKKTSLGADYSFSYYSDGNSNHEPGLDILYCFSLEPRRFSLKYRYYYRNFDEKKNDYFSPKGFSVNSLSLNWRHYLNKEELFFGADDLFYDLSYAVSVDSEDIVSHKFGAELNWDVNKRLNFNIKASQTETSAGVYRDRNILVSMKYYF